MVYGAVRIANGQTWVEDATDWSVIMPFHNERRYLRATIASLAGQSVRPLLILVDNASTDRSAELAREACREFGIDAVHLHESRPGKVAALQRGLAAVETRFVATCDADTIYPPQYLAEATRLLDRPHVAAAVAAYSRPGSSAMTSRLAGWRMALTSRVLPQQCLNGGAGQVFRTGALRECGGFDPAIWNWVLEDHEIMARIEQFGGIAYGAGFYCQPESRPRAVDCTGWTLREQLRYHATRSSTRIAFFHQVLGPRLRERALRSEMLRRSRMVVVSA